MAYSFTREMSVLYFGPRAHARPAWREYLLWPAWAYRIVAPRIRDRPLNLFQRAVLGLCRAGVAASDTIGQRLAIHADMAAFLLVELIELGHMNPDGSPTEQGHRILDEDVIEAHDMVAGYIFQDPWSGELWPRFVERLDYCELEYEEGGFPRLLLGSTGKPWRQGAFMVMPGGGTDVSRPSPANVVAAVSGHRKGLRHAGDPIDWDEGLAPLAHSSSALHINRVSFVEEAPHAIYLATYLYLTDGASEGADWYACDPFGLGASVRLRRRVEQVMQTMPPLYGVVDRLVQHGVHAGLEGQKRWIEQLQLSAALEVERRLTLNIRTHEVFEALVNMEFARQEVGQLSPSCPTLKVQAALRECSKVLEALFTAIANDHPLTTARDRVLVTRVDPRTGHRRPVPQNDKALLSAIYRCAALAVGFEEPIPQALLNVTAGQVQSVTLRGEHWRLRPLVTATLLAAQLDQQHPLWRAAREAPHMLVEIDDIATAGGRAGHASDQPLDIEDVERTVERAYSVVGVISGLVPAAKHAADKEGQATHE